MWIARTVTDLRRHRQALHGSVALVPTMGALHGGHLSLIDRGKSVCEHVIVTIFVNPTQFGPHEDYTAYPRSEDRDLVACEQSGVAGVFIPAVEHVYPVEVPATELAVPSMMATLEAEHRTGHLQGVVRVVLKLLNMVQPDAACFGRKDFQQLRVVQAMVADLYLPVSIIECDTVRDPDGLAVSSRNVHLSPQARGQALGLHKALCHAQTLVEQSGETEPRRVESAMRQVLQSHHVTVDYAVVRHPVTMVPLDCLEPALTGGVVALVAGRVGGVRLIDNMMLAQPPSAADRDE